MLGSPTASAQQAGTPAAQDPRFEIRSFIVEGATLVPHGEIDAAVKAFRGAGKDFSDVQRALEALERLYSARGFNAVQVILPEQEIEKGEVRFKVVEARIGRVIIEGNKFFDDANIRESLPSITPGLSPNIHDIANNLRLANENPARQTTVLLRGGSEEGLVDAVVRVTDENPTRYSVTFDNTGTGQTGIYRIGFGYQNANFLSRDHVLSAQYVTAPIHHANPNKFDWYPDKNVMILGGSYRIPFYRQGNSLDITFGYSNVNSGLLQNLFNVSGAGSIFGARYNINLPPWENLDQRMSVGLDWRAYRNRIIQVGTSTSLVPDLTVHPITVSYNAVHRTANSETSFTGSVSENLPGGDDGGSTTFFITRPGARPGYLVWRWGLNHNRAFANDWQFRFGWNAQFTRDKLPPAEQFGIGGVDSIRGFTEREITNDYGSRGTLELYTPDLGSKFEWLGGVRLRGLAFYDWGQVHRFQPLFGEAHRQTAGSVGLGLRLSRGASLSLRLDWAVVADAAGGQGRGDGRLHASMAYIF